MVLEGLSGGTRMCSSGGFSGGKGHGRIRGSGRRLQQGESAMEEQEELAAGRVGAHCRSHQDLHWSVCEDAVTQPDSSETSMLVTVWGGVGGGEEGWQVEKGVKSFRFG